MTHANHILTELNQHAYLQHVPSMLTAAVYDGKNFTFPESPLPVILSERGPVFLLVHRSLYLSAHALDFSCLGPPPSCVSSSCLPSLSLVLIFLLQVCFSIPPPLSKQSAALAIGPPPPLLSQGTREQCEGISRMLLRVVWPCGGPRLKRTRSASLTSQ